MTASFFWRIFELTGSITAYLLYKQCLLIELTRSSL
ncbi:MAG: YqzL family protein [Clostridia bacterium]